MTPYGIYQIPEKYILPLSTDNHEGLTTYQSDLLFWFTETLPDGNWIWEVSDESFESNKNDITDSVELVKVVTLYIEG